MFVIVGFLLAKVLVHVLFYCRQIRPNNQTISTPAKVFAKNGWLYNQGLIDKARWQKRLWQHSFKTNLRSSFNDMTKLSNALKMLRSVDFEVFGTVQGVFFRKYTKDKGQQLGLKGWCMNTSQGTVVGTIQGKEEKIDDMKDWLRHTGSPSSHIEKCVFTNERHISKEEFDDFYIKKKGRMV